MVFNSEPGRVSGNVVTGRKGGVFMAFRVTGRAAHSGANFADGISAIEELARKTQALHALTDLDRGITVNVGLVRGGQSVNTVAPWAEGEIDLRYVDPPDRDDAMAHITAIIERAFVPGTRTELTVRGEFLPLVQTPTAKKTVRDLRAGRGRHRVRHSGRVYRRLCGFRFYRRCGCADDLRGRAGGRQGAQPRRVSAHRQPRPARAGLRQGDHAIGASRALTIAHAHTGRFYQLRPCQPWPLQPPPNATTPPG